MGVMTRQVAYNSRGSKEARARRTGWNEKRDRGPEHYLSDPTDGRQADSERTAAACSLLLCQRGGINSCDGGALVSVSLKTTGPLGLIPGGPGPGAHSSRGRSGENEEI